MKIIELNSDSFNFTSALAYLITLVFFFCPVQSGANQDLTGVFVKQFVFCILELLRALMLYLYLADDIMLMIWA